MPVYVPETANIMDINHPVIKQLINHVRLYMRDFKELNRLTDGLDHSDRHIFWAILDTLSDWAATPPFGVTNIDIMIERGWFGLLVRGVAISLLESLGILHMRNFLSYSDGGVNVQTENPQMIQAWLTMAKNEYEQKKQRVLIAKNIEDLLYLSGVQSEYLLVNSFFGAW